MNNSRIFDLRIVVALLVSILFGLLFNKLLPLLSIKPLYLLALPLSVVFFAILIIKPIWVFTVIFLARPLLDNSLNLTKSGGGFGAGAVVNLAVIILAAFLAIYQSTFPNKEKTVRIWIIYLFLMFLSVLYSPYMMSGVRLYFNYVSYFAMFLLPFLLIKTEKDFISWLKIFACSFILPVFNGYWDLAHGGKYFADAGTRISGPFTHPNILAFYMVLGITFYFYLLKTEYLKHKPKIMICMKIMIMAMLFLLVATKSRNAWIACAGIFMIHGFLKDRKLLLMLLLLIPLSLSLPQVRERLHSISSGEKQEYSGLNSFEWRLRMWESSLPLIKQKPLHGYGLTSFKPMSVDFSNVGRNMGAHNAYLEILFETGLIGLISFLGLLISPLLIFFKNMRNAAGKIPSTLWGIGISYLISYMIICSADNLSYYLAFNWYVWFFIGLMLVSERFINDKP